jgi:hypothetical protein
MPTYSENLAEIQRLRNELRSRERQAEAEAKRMQPLSEAQERQMYADQATFDQAYMAAGRKAQPPHAYERPDQYKRRLADGLKVYSDRWAKADFNKIPDDAFEIVAAQVHADAMQHGRNHGLAAREVRELPSTSASGHRTVDFVGGALGWFGRQFERPARRAVFQSPEHYAAMSRDAQMARLTEIVRHRPTPQPMRTGF